jgi:chemotaxis protein CheD
MQNLRPSLAQRANDSLSTQSYFQSGRYIYDPSSEVEIVKIFSGDWHVSTNPNEMLTTILGSCVAACVRDPVAGVGGMNHFLLPGDESTPSPLSDAARYGVFAMEKLINAILHWGGERERLEFKVFGGGNVTNNSARIGSKNAAFIRQFLQDEGFTVTCEDLEGDLPRRVHYFPVSGKVMMRRLQRREDFKVVEEEKRYTNTIASRPVEGAIDLF